MTPRRVNATRRQIARLMGDIQAVPAHPVGDHLTDDEFVGYSMAELDGDDSTRIEGHLRSCDDCAAQMERLFDVAHEWQGPAGAARVEQLSRAVTSNPRRDSPGSVKSGVAVHTVAFHAGLPAAASASLEEQTDIGHVVFADDAERNLYVAVSSSDRSLEGREVIVDPFGETFVLTLRPPDQVGGEIRIPWTAREHLPEHAKVRLRMKASNQPRS